MASPFLNVRLCTIIFTAGTNTFNRDRWSIAITGLNVAMNSCTKNGTKRGNFINNYLYTLVLFPCPVVDSSNSQWSLP